MKLLVQGDDFGFTRGVTFGIVDSIDRGILRNTGLFANMPSAELAVSYMADRPQACFGIDFNLVSGPSCSDPATIPHLVDENGMFIRSNIRIKDPRWQTEEGRREMFPWEETYREIRAQYDRFVELTGKKPGYLHGHSISHEHYVEAIRKVGEEEGVPYSSDIREKYNFGSMFQYIGRGGASTSKHFDPAEQLAKNPLKNILDHKEEILANHEYFMIGGHPGFIDDELLGLTSLSLERCKDAAMCQSEELKKWIEENNIELITYYDLY